MRTSRWCGGCRRRIRRGRSSWDQESELREDHRPGKERRDERSRQTETGAGPDSDAREREEQRERCVGHVRTARSAAVALPLCGTVRFRTICAFVAFPSLPRASRTCGNGVDASRRTTSTWSTRAAHDSTKDSPASTGGRSTIAVEYHARYLVRSDHSMHRACGAE